jgi:4-aminobutyrate aminotransferase-like enzyme
VLDRCREQGLLLLSAGEKVVRLAPPLIVEAADCAKAIQILGDVLAKVGT